MVLGAVTGLGGTRAVIGLGGSRGSDRTGWY